MQNSFRIKVRSIELFRRIRSPIAPNANPATSRANDGRLASMPVFAKLNWSTSFMNFGAAEIIETKLIRKCWPRERESWSFLYTRHQEEQAPHVSIVQKHQCQKRQRCQQFPIRRNCFLRRHRVTKRFFDIRTFLSGNTWMFGWGIGHQNEPRNRNQKCDDCTHMERPIPAKAFHNITGQWQCDHRSQSTAEQRRYKFTFFVGRWPFGNLYTSLMESLGIGSIDE